MIILAGHLQTSPDDVAALADALRSLVAPTLSEDGCLAYHFAVDCPDSGTVLVYERWRDQAALSAHLAQPSVLAVLGDWGARIDTSGVIKFDAANPRGFMD